MLSIRSSLLLAVTVTGLFLTACPGGGLFPKPKSASSASAAAPASTATASAAPTPAPVLSGSLKSDWVLASKVATGWSPDAALYEIEGQGIDDSGQRDVAEPNDVWTFRFASAARSGQLLTVAITGKDQVISQPITGTAPYPTFKYGALGLDSPASFRKASVSGKSVRTNVYFDSRYGMVVYLFPEQSRLRLDAWTGDPLN